MSKLMVCVDMVQTLPVNAEGMLVLDPDKMWRDPEKPSPEPVIIDVGFMDGDPGLRKEVLAVASGWSRHANVQFIASNRPVESCTIRITFTLPGSWSYVGKDCLALAKSKPTMNYGWLTPQSSQEEISRVVLHEFGHALGCVHEHSHPDGGIPWNLDRLYPWYLENKGWDKAMVDSQVLRRYDRTLTARSRTAFDHKSIMLYPIPAELTDGVFHTDLNTELSEGDKAFIARMYPRPG